MNGASRLICRIEIKSYSVCKHKERDEIADVDIKKLGGDSLIVRLPKG